jgi:hypothetical protein
MRACVLLGCQRWQLLAEQLVSGVESMKRVLSGASYVEINNHKKRVGRDLRAALYLYDNSKLIATSIAGFCETDEPTVLTVDAPNVLVGETICDHLLRFHPKTPRRSENLKKTDWPAYQVSGARSVSSFESHCWMVHIKTIGDNSVSMLAVPYKSLHPEVGVEGTARPEHEQVGAVLRRALNSAFAVRAAGLI